MKTFWAELAWLGGDAAEVGVRITVVDGRITKVEANTEPEADSHQLAGLTIPGMANAHSHAFHRALRTRTQRGEGSFWTWRDRMYEVSDRLDPDNYFELAKAVYGEMALAGITTVGEFHYVHHQPGGGAV